MAENYKFLYQSMKLMVERYQDELVPQLRAELEKRVDVVRCKDCKHKMEYPIQPSATFCDVWAAFNGMGDDGYCNYGERKDNER